MYIAENKPVISNQPNQHNLNNEPTTTPVPEGELKRTIGVFGLACSVINITVGTGIFVLPALVAENLGAAAVLCFIICGLLMFFIALCFAEVGSKVTANGGTYAYIEAAFGPFAGFLTNNIFWISCCLSDAAVANGLSKTLGYFYAPLDGALKPVLFFVLFGGLAWINIRQTKDGVKFMIVSTFAKLVPLLLIVLWGVSHVATQNLQWKASFSVNDIGSASLILFFAFLGIENSVTNSGEFKNPAKVVPLGILSGLSFVLLLYIAIQLITQGILGDQLNTFKDAPLVEVSKRLFAYTGIILITIGAAVSMLGSLSGSILAIPRVLYAGAKDGIFPGFLGNVHAKYLTPHKAIIAYATVDYLLAVFGAFKQLVILTTASILLIYLGVVLSAIKLRYKKTPGEKAFTLPGGITIHLMATAAIIWLLFSLSRQEVIALAVTLCSLSGIYLLMKWYKGKQNVKV